MKNPFTTILGILAALGTALSTVPGTIGTIAHWVGIGATAVFGAAAADGGSSNTPASK